ncbi:hypothetical protein CKQ90_27740, partial [Klebsiella pneumoniae]
DVETPKHAAVLGAGIMGGGIAYQSAWKGVPVVMERHQRQIAKKPWCWKIKALSRWPIPMRPARWLVSS